MRRNVGIVAKALGDDVERFVVVGAAAASFFELSPAVRGLRVTEDVDLIVEVVSYSSYNALIDRLRNEGRLEDPPMSQEAPVCRYIVEGVLVDFMPLDEQILGFGNRWYEEAARSSDRVSLADGIVIRIVTPTYFIATKLDAFSDRGANDVFGSHDLEDLLTVLAGDRRLIEHIGGGTGEVHRWIRGEFARLLDDASFRSAVPGHVEAGMLPPFDCGRFVDRLREMSRG